jgi:hypothetical protein
MISSSPASHPLYLPKLNHNEMKKHQGGGPVVLVSIPFRENGVSKVEIIYNFENNFKF